MDKILSKLKRFIQSPWTMAALLVMYAVAMAVATFVESSHGTQFVREYFYTSWWFILLQEVMIVNFIAMSIRFKLLKQRKWGALVLHYAFVTILIGAMVTNLTGKEGIMHIREGETTNKIYNNKTGVIVGELPFTVTLTDFRLVRYPGSGSPSSYESDVVIDGKHEKIYMNNIVYKDGYRLYQSSYDHDEKGTVLSVNQDAAGTLITYIGYLLMVIGFILTLMHKNSHFRVLLRSLSVVALMLAALNASAQKMSQAERAMAIEQAQKSVVSKEIADKFGQLLVQTRDGRIEPFDTYASKLLRKIAREKSFEGMSPNQVILGIVTNPEIWSYVPVIKDGRELISFVDVLDSTGNYIYGEEVDKIYEKPVRERSKTDKDILKLDERINIFHALFSGEMLPIFPNIVDRSNRWYSPADDLSAFQGQDSMFVSKIFVWFGTEVRKDPSSAKALEIVGMIDTYQNAKGTGINIDKKRVEAEIFYNKADVFKWSAFAYMGLGFLFLIVLIIDLLKRGKTTRALIWIFSALVIGVFLWHTFGIGLRWYIAGRAPVSNAYETMVYVGWATIMAGLLFMRRSKITLALAAIFGGLILFVSNLNFMDPEITPLVPVLKSYWLMIHVAVITGSYGFFGIGFLLGVVKLILMCLKGDKLQKQINELYTINQLVLTIGLVLLTIGTFLGAVWANESWGRYWGWDPKETWALITIIVYTFIIHSRFMAKLRTPYAFAVMSIIGLGSVLMTFFGVNYYLSGLHSYGGDSAPPALNIIYFVYAAIAILAIVAYFKTRKK